MKKKGTKMKWARKQKEKDRNKIMILLIMSILFLCQTSLASPPQYFARFIIRLDSLNNLASGSFLEIYIDRPTRDYSDINIKCIYSSNIRILGAAEFVFTDFPIYLRVPFSLINAEVGIFKVEVRPTLRQTLLPPLRKTLYIKSIAGVLELIIPKVGEEEKIEKKLLPTLYRRFEERDTTAVLRNTRMKCEQDSFLKGEVKRKNSSASSLGTINVYGYWTYQDQNGVGRPIKFARVEVWDNEPVPFPPVLLRTGYTDANGYYYFGGINNDDGWLEGGLDIFVKAHCDYWENSNKCAYVTDGNILNIPYWGQTDVRGNVPDGNVNLGTWVFTDPAKRGSWGIYHSALKAYEHFKNASPSFDTPKVLVKWPYGDWPRFFGFWWFGLYHIEIPSGWEWEGEATAHEFSHATMYKMYGDRLPPMERYDSHWESMESDAGFALTEGWAEFAASLIYDNTSFEGTLYADGQDDNDFDGEIVEGAVAEVLWDISDGANDDGVPYKFGNLMYILPNYKPNSIKDIKLRWQQIGYSYQAELQQIYYAQKIEQPPPPAAPTNLTASAVSSSQINLTWQDKATNETGYKVERKTGSTGTWGEIKSLGTNATSYSNTGLTDGTRYYYRVYAYNSAGNSGYSNEANDKTPMNAPSNLIATAVSSSQIDLSWQDNSKSESGYRIERKTGAGGIYSEIVTVGANVTSYSDKGLSEGTTYYYRVRGYNALVTSAYSNEANATTPVSLPAVPTNLTASAVSSSQINLTWQDKATNETGYKVERETGSTGTWGEIKSLGTNATSYSNTGLTDGTRYYYRVYAYNSAGNSGYSNEANDKTPMNAPSNLIATAVSSSQIDLSWQDNSGSESGYRIERKTGAGGTYSEIATVGANVTSYSNTGLIEGTTYYYRVRGYNSLVTSAYSNEDYASAVPVELMSFVGRITNNRVVVLEWTTATESNNLGFDIERKLQSDSAGVETEKWYKIGFVPGSGTTTIPHGYRFEDKSLMVPDTYHYRLKQIDSDGSFNYSPVVSVVVEAPHHFVLRQNHPNPFNSETTIQYQLSKRSLVILSIYNALGREICRLVSEEKEVGYHQIRWNGKDDLGRDVASGIYLYCLEAGDFIATQKMLLLR